MSDIIALPCLSSVFIRRTSYCLSFILFAVKLLKIQSLRLRRVPFGCQSSLDWFPQFIWQNPCVLSYIVIVGLQGRVRNSFVERTYDEEQSEKKMWPISCMIFGALRFFVSCDRISVKVIMIDKKVCVKMQYAKCTSLWNKINFTRFGNIWRLVCLKVIRD